MLSIVLLAIALVVFVALMVRGLGRRRPRRKPFADAASPDDDSPTGYTPGIWLLGADSAKPRDEDAARRDSKSPGGPPRP